MRSLLPGRSRAALVLMLALGLGASALLTGCGDDDGPVVVQDLPDAVALMQALADSLANIPDDPDEDDIRPRRYTVIRNGFDAILAADPSNRIAHLGVGILEVLEINYDADLWAFLDDLIDYSDSTSGRSSSGGLFVRLGSPILRNQFTLLATAPRELMRRSMRAIPSSLTVARAQALIDSVVIPALTESITHLEQAEADGGPVFNLTVEDESYEIDIGEIYAFHAATHAARAAFRLLTAYDLGLPGPDGTYGWIDTMNDIPTCERDGEFELVSADSSRRISINYGQDPGSAAKDSVGVAIIQYNLEQRPDFLRQRTGGLAGVLADMRRIRELLSLGVAAVKGESDDQMNDVIKIVDLTDIDQDIANATDPPNFAENFTTIEDVLNWVNQILSGPYDVQEDGEFGPIEITVDLAGFLGNAPLDWNSLLPFHQFRPPASWVEADTTLDVTFGSPYGVPHSVIDCETGVETWRSDVFETRRLDINYSVNPIEFLDGPGGSVIDLDVVKIPYFDNYTLGGLFPGATRATWETIRDNAGW
jgi:hypothetical protein